ncbi:MAG: oligosaccharide flippase family protein [Byssovorax sp.]
MRQEGKEGKAVRGAGWALVTSALTRVLGMGGMLVLTRLLDPAVYGEVTLASIVVTTASIAALYGISQHPLVRPRASPEEVFHAAVYFMALGVLGLGLTVWIGPYCSGFLKAPGFAAYLPGLAVANLLDRAVQFLDRVATQRMHFRALGLQRLAGEIAYVGVTLVLAARGWGGQCLVWGSIARAALKLVALIVLLRDDRWARPVKLDRRHTREVLSAGVPITIAWIANTGSRLWDNLLFARFFGPGPQAVYNTAYNIAEIPTLLVGVAIGDVLTALLGRSETEAARQAMMLRATRLLLLITAPLSVGLAAVAPVITSFFDERWSAIAPMLALLSLFAVIRPITWIGNAYLQVANELRALTVLEVSRALSVVVIIALVGGRGPLWVCAGAGLAFSLNALGFHYVLVRRCGFRWRDVLVPLVPPIVACIPMGLAVTALHSRLALPPWLALIVEVGAGAAVFVPAAFLFAPTASRDLLGLLRGALRRGAPG